MMRRSGVGVRLMFAGQVGERHQGLALRERRDGPVGQRRAGPPARGLPQIPGLFCAPRPLQRPVARARGTIAEPRRSPPGTTTQCPEPRQAESPAEHTQEATRPSAGRDPAEHEQLRGGRRTQRRPKIVPGRIPGTATGLPAHLPEAEVLMAPRDIRDHFRRARDSTSRHTADRSRRLVKSTTIAFVTPSTRTSASSRGLFCQRRPGCHHSAHHRTGRDRRDLQARPRNTTAIRRTAKDKTSRHSTIPKMRCARNASAFGTERMSLH